MPCISRSQTGTEHALSLPEILVAVLSHFDESQLRTCRSVSRLWNACTSTVRQQRARHQLVMTFPGPPGRQYCFQGADVLDGTSGRVMQFKPSPGTDPRIVLHPWLSANDKPLEILVNSKPLQVHHFLDRYLVCHGLTLQVSNVANDEPPRAPSLKMCYRVDAVYKPLSPKIWIHPIVGRLCASWVHRDGRVVTALWIYLTTTNIEQLVRLILDGLQDSLDYFCNTFANERNQLQILRRMKHDARAAVLVRTILQKTDHRLSRAISMLNILDTDLAYASRDELQRLARNAFIGQMADMHSPRSVR